MKSTTKRIKLDRNKLVGFKQAKSPSASSVGKSMVGAKGGGGGGDISIV